MPPFAPHPLVWTPAAIQRFFVFDRRHRPQGERPAPNLRKLLRWASRYVELQGLHVLDYGCGDGTLMRLLQDAGAFRVEGKEVGQPLPGTPGSFTLCICTEVLEHLEEAALRQAVQEMASALAPEGLLLVTTPFQENLDASTTMCAECGAIFNTNQHVRSWTPAAMRQLWEQEGVFEADFRFKTLVCRGVYLWNDAGWVFRTFRNLARWLTRQAPIPPDRLVYVGIKS